ncbi:TIGR01841 family phasin [Acuticoccus sp. M5D2P5]|uniref:phasin family protein n=1 Tax=Acuticoccus kalidii TaxID=2910977 RepID=UPI001F15EC5E|nr:TIGR01841 family phasin [Acuticoccus kalidii]MCF3936011.1 TIGR01841 family phasin [Acuticoccus kalidii]
MSTNENLPNTDAVVNQTFEAAHKATEEFASVLPGSDATNMVREIAVHGITSARQFYETARNAAEDATDMMEDTYEHARKSFTEMNLKLIDQAQANTDRVFAFAKEVAGAKTVSEAVELQTKFAREQFEAFAAQARELQETAQKLAGETAGPMKDAWEKATNKFNS